MESWNYLDTKLACRSLPTAVPADRMTGCTRWLTPDKATLRSPPASGWEGRYRGGRETRRCVYFVPPPRDTVPPTVSRCTPGFRPLTFNVFIFLHRSFLFFFGGRWDLGNVLNCKPNSRAKVRRMHTTRSWELCQCLINAIIRSAIW